MCSLQRFGGEGGAEDEKEMMQAMRELFPLNRSLTGNGVRQTIAILSDFAPFNVHEIPSNTQVGDWIVPDEWNLRSARIEDDRGRTVITTQDTNLHVVGYSEPVNVMKSWRELLDEGRLHVGPADMPNAVPYVTSYYERTWGFCVSHDQMMSIRSKYPPLEPLRCVVDATLEPGSMTLADVGVSGYLPEEIIFTSYVCHPSMANNELSGPVVLAALAQWVMSEPRRYSYRFVLAPETIGAIAYLERFPHTRNLWKAGYVLTCLGGPGSFVCQAGPRPSYAFDVLMATQEMEWWGWNRRASDERQYCAPGVDLPFVSLSKTRPGQYREYHTSKDDLSYVTEDQLQESLALLRRLVTNIERDHRYRVSTVGEPMLGRHGLYSNTSKVGSSASGKELLDLWNMSDGRKVSEVATAAGRTFDDVAEKLELLEKVGAVSR